MSNVIVSVIIPVFNSEELLKQCLDSVLNQTLKDFEIICVDDGSTDNSLEILRKYEENDERIIVLYQENAGAGVARNKGIEIAKGEYIAFIDSDDWIESDALEKLYNNIKHNDSDMVLFNSVEHKPNNEFRERIYLPKDSSIDYNNFTFDYKYRKNFVMNGMMVIWSKFYKTSFIRDNNIKFYSHEIFNDVQFHIQSMLFAKKISYLPEILYHYRRMGQSSLQTSRAVTRRGFILFDIFDEIEEWLKEKGFFEEFETNFYRFMLNESQGRLDRTDDSYKEDLFKILKERIAKRDISTEQLKKMNIRNYRFYIHLINSNSYFEYEQFLNSSVYGPSDLSLSYIPKSLNKAADLNLSYIIEEKDKEISNLKEFSINSIDSLKTKVELINRLNKFNFFDEEFYQSNYDCENLEPILHYVTKGYKLGNKPNAEFDHEFYANFNKNVLDSGLDSFFYFVLYGIDEGIIRINKNTRQPRSVNKIELSSQIKKFNKLGVNKNTRTPRIIVSLTSFPERMYDIHYCLYSLLTQRFKPDKLVLWLAKSQFPNKEKDLPQTLLSLKENGLEIKWCQDMGAYKKLLPSLKEYPNDIIVTADDDLYYPDDWLKKLYDDYIKYPNTLIVHRARDIKFNEDNTLKGYNHWPLFTDAVEPSFLNFSTNGAGTLFPPNSLNKKILDYNLAKKLSPTSDDVWIWVMAVLNRTKIRVVKDNMYALTYVNPAREMNILNETTLWSSNSKGSNDVNINNLITKFPEIMDIINEEFDEKTE